MRARGEGPAGGQAADSKGRCRGIASLFACLLLLALPSPLLAETKADTAPKDGATAEPADSAALSAAKSALLPALSSADLEARTAKSSRDLEPGDAAKLYEYLAGWVTDASVKSRFLATASDLRLLLGQFAEAAQDAETAVASKSSGPSEAAERLRAARLWLAAGETDKASRLAALVIGSSKDELLLDSARLVAAWASLLSGGPPLAMALAGGIAGPPSGNVGKDALRREAAFLLWVAGDAKTRETQAKNILAGWPKSPEAGIVSSSARVSLMALPHWYLGGLALPPPASTDEASSASAAPRSASPTSGEAPSPSSGAPATGAPQSSSAADATEGASQTPLRYQVGVFSTKDHAQALVDELAKKGFQGKIESRKVGDQTLFSVVLSPKDTKDNLVDRLKDAGYEAWLLPD